MNRFLLPLTVVLSSSGLLLVDSAIKGAALLVFASLVVLMLRRDSAATRHLVWLVAIVAMLFVPALSALLPQWRVLPEWATLPTEIDAGDTVPVNESDVMNVKYEANEIEMTFSADHFPAAELPESAIQATPAMPSPPIASDNPVAATTESSVVTLWASVLPFVWAIGFLLLIVRLLAARLLLWQVERTARIIPHGERQGVSPPCLPASAINQSTAKDSTIVAAFNAARLQLAVRGRITLLIHPDKTIPVVWGIIRHRLLLPTAALEWSDEQLRSVLLHELAHINRLDTLSQLLAQTACALHWFNPLVWFAAWRLHVERERACDDLVLASGVRASAYAEHLLNIATRLTSSRRTQACGLAMARSSSLHGRLHAVLSEKQNRRKVTTTLLILSVVLSGAVAIPVAMLRAADETPSTESVVEKRVVKEALKPWAYRGVDAALLRRWQQLEGQEKPIPEARVATLRSAIGRFIEGIDESPFSLTQEQISTLRTLQTHGAQKTRHTDLEVRNFINTVFAVHGEPIQMAFNEASWPGTPGNAEDLERLPFGPAAPNGLRVALICEKENFIFGDSARLDLQLWNSGSETLVVGIGRNSPGLYPKMELQAIGRDGRRIATTMSPESKMLAETKFTRTWQLRPGETADVHGYRLRVGSGTPRENEGWPEWYTNIEMPDAHNGEEILLTGTLPALTAPGTQSSSTEMQTGSIKINATAPEDIRIWSAGGAGRWPMPDGVTLEVKQECFHAADIATNVVLTWPKDVTGTTHAFTSDVAADAFANRQPWHVAWERNSTSFWTMTGDLGRSETGLAKPFYLRRIDLTDKLNIITTTWYHQPEAMPEGIRLAFEKVFQPLPATPRLASEVDGSVQTEQAHDVRPIDELLHGVWRNNTGEVDVRLTFPERDTDGIQWSVDFRQGIPVVDATLSRIRYPADNSIRLWMRPEPISNVDEKDIVGIVRRGPDLSLLLDITGSPRYPEYRKVTGIVLTRAQEPGVNVMTTKPDASQSVDSVKATHLPPGLEQHLNWSDPVNGLRAAVMIRTMDSPGIAGKERKIFVVIQNVSDTPIRFCDTAIQETDVPAADTEGRNLYLQDNGEILAGRQRAVSTHSDIVLQPQDVFSIDMLNDEKANEQGLKSGDGLAEGIVKVPTRAIFAVLNIVNAPDGAWTGKLTTPSTRGAFAAEGPIPTSKEGQAFFRYCVDHARLNSDIPGGLISRLHDMVQEFIRLNTGDQSGDSYAKKMQPLVARFENKGDWKQGDVVTLFDDIAAVTTIPLERIMEKIRESTLQRGQQLPTSLKDANWGEALPGGLRMAWILEPRSEKYHLGATLKSHVVIHNSGSKPVMFVTRSFHQPGHTAKRSSGGSVNVESTFWTTRGRPEPYRLHPGESCEVYAPGIGIGPQNHDDEDWANVGPGSWILANEGDDIVLQPGDVLLTGDHNAQVDPDWWLKFITERISRDAPLPNDPKEREVVLFRVISDLFGNSPTPEEAAAFLPDTSPDAVQHLATLLSDRTWHTSVAGPIKSGEIKFHVLPEDPDAATRPRVTMNPGRYNLGEDVRFVVTRRSIGDRIVNEADVIWYPAGKDAVPTKVLLPDGYDTWAAAWLPATTVLWVQQTSGIRRYDFSAPSAVIVSATETDLVPTAIREAMAAVLEAPEVPGAPMPAAATPAASSSKVDLDLLEGMWKGQRNGISVELSFPWHSEHQQVQWRVSTPDAGISAQMSVDMEPDGNAAQFVFRKEVEFEALQGRVTAGEGGTLRLEIIPNPNITDPGYPAVKDLVLTRQPGNARLWPKHETAQSLLKKWAANARTDGRIPGALIGHVAKAVDDFVNRYRENDATPKLAALRPKLDSSHDWKPVGNSTFVARVFSRLNARTGPERLSPSRVSFL